MSNIAIRCEHLSKRYRIGERESYKALRDVITDGVASPFRRLRSALTRNGGSSNGSALSTQDAAFDSKSSSLITHDSSLDTNDSALGSETRNSKLETQNSFWALNDVSFEVKPGEVVGIIGRNGAGKSTLLKILSRITKPTRGHAQIHGRVGSLLEVGTGFHPELTGRENIYLNAAILGMRKAEVARKFDEIVAFAEVEKFMDTPVKRYSSGMYVRLAFAVAAHMDTEILLVDEVLAVGDAQFHKKCLGKMGDVAKQGRTVLFVSHNLGVIRRICEKAICLKDGGISLEGGAEEVVDNYLSQDVRNEGEVRWVKGDENSGDHRVRISRISLLGSTGRPANTFRSDETIDIEIEYFVFESLSVLRVGVILSTADGIEVLTTGDTSRLDWTGERITEGRYVSRCSLPPNMLAERNYVVSVFVNIPLIENIVIIERLLQFEVMRAETIANRHNWGWPGVICPELKWEVRQFPPL